MVFPVKPSSKSLGKRPARNTTATTNSSLSTYTPSRESSALDGDVDYYSAPPTVVSVGRGRPNNQKRVLPSRARRGGPGAGIGYGDVDLSILDLLKRRGESDPLIPSKTVFILTTDTSFMPAASSSEIGLNCCANERFFERPEVIKAFKEQQDIQIPEFTQLAEEKRVGGRLRARSGGTVDMDLSDAAYEKRHRKHELAEKRQRLREKEQLEHEQYKLRERVEQLRTMDSSIFLALPAGAFATDNMVTQNEGGIAIISSPSVNDTSHEGERRRQIMLDAAETLEARYRALLPDKKISKKDRIAEPSPAASVEPSILDGELDDREEEREDSAIDNAPTIASNRLKAVKPNLKPHNRLLTAPPSTSPYRLNRSVRVSSAERHMQVEMLDEDQPEADSITVTTSRHPAHAEDAVRPNSLHNAHAITRLDILKNQPHTPERSLLNGDHPPSYHETANSPRLSVMEVSKSISQFGPVGPVVDIHVSVERDPKKMTAPLHKKQKLQLEQLKLIKEPKRIHIDGIPDFSPTAAFPASELFANIGDLDLPALALNEEDDVDMRSERSELAGQLEDITISVHETINHPPKRRVGRPRKHPLPPDAEGQPTAPAPTIQDTSNSPKRRAATAPVFRYDSPEIVPPPSIAELTRTPLIIYEPIRGPGRRPFVPGIIAASAHNTDFGRKSGRSVKAFGAEVPSFDERESEFGLPEEIIEEVEETRNGPGSLNAPPVQSSYLLRNSTFASVSVTDRT